MRTVLVTLLATAVVGANVASAVVFSSVARENANAARSLETTLSAIARRLPPPGATAPAAPPTAPVAAPPSAETLLRRGIVRLDDREFLVYAQTANDILEDQAGFMRAARIVPDQQNGKVVGVRLFGVTPRSVLDLLGIENGDRIETVNGYDLTNPENALSAYNTLRRNSDVFVLLNRRGQTVTLHYRIV
jgi:general secretion pathway protein C